MASATVFHESYGDVSRPQLAAYRKHNVSQSDHDDLVERFGKDNHNGITLYVKNNAERHNGTFNVMDLYLGM